MDTAFITILAGAALKESLPWVNVQGLVCACGHMVLRRCVCIHHHHKSIAFACAQYN